MKQAVGYIRVSTEEQGKSGFGLQSQEATIRAIAKSHGYRLGPVYEEVASAISTSAHERPKLQEAIHEARRRRRPLLVASWDRLSRDAVEIEAIVRKSGIEIIDAVVGRSADLAAMQAEAARVGEETRMLSERTRAGMLRAKQQGKQFGNTRNLPEAQKKGAAATKRNAEIRDAEITSIILRSRGRPLSQVADELNRCGSRTARGKPWCKDSLRRVRRRIELTEQQRERNQLAHLESPHWGIF
ncbi:MAG: recombinase family protein [Xanthobacteraceae bacterium]|jgi:DNA invertase Pin-like site-specific DNA recombinase